MVPEPAAIWSTDVFLQLLGATWLIWGTILGRAGFRLGPKIVTLGHHLGKTRNKKVSQNETKNNHDVLIEECSQNEWLLEVKVSVWQGTCCEVHISVCHEILRKSMPKLIPKATKIEAQTAPKSDFWIYAAIRRI